MRLLLPIICPVATELPDSYRQVDPVHEPRLPLADQDLVKQLLERAVQGCCTDRFSVSQPLSSHPSPGFDDSRLSPRFNGTFTHEGGTSPACPFSGSRPGTRNGGDVL